MGIVLGILAFFLVLGLVIGLIGILIRILPILLVLGLIIFLIVQFGQDTLSWTTRLLFTGTRDVPWCFYVSNLDQGNQGIPWETWSERPVALESQVGRWGKTSVINKIPMDFVCMDSVLISYLYGNFRYFVCSNYRNKVVHVAGSCLRRMDFFMAKSQIFQVAFYLLPLDSS